MRKDLGWGLVFDDGHGIISKWEPTQGIFLSKDAFKVLSVADIKQSYKNQTILLKNGTILKQLINYILK
jgi:hypothetical protein